MKWTPPVVHRQGRSQDFSEGGSQEPRQQRRRRGVCDARAHTGSIYADSFSGHFAQCASALHAQGEERRLLNIDIILLNTLRV